MIKPNWNVFKAKFSDDPQFHFEWFCYLLFCKETDKPFGVLRYKNQSAIETNPVDLDGHCLGFQSKFYDTTLTSNKVELIGTLVKAKRDYPELTKLYLYTNQEWTQAFPQLNNPTKKAEKTAAQKEIESKASQLNIELEWRTTSYFESPFVCQNCDDISKFFFLNDNSLLDLINVQERHTQSILKYIKQSIPFKEHEISIERSSVLESLKETSTQVSIVCGKGGVGKTVEIKKFYQEFKDTHPIFAFKANEFEIKKLDHLTLGYSINDLLSLFGDSEDKVLVIDSAEKLMDLSNQEPIKEFIDLSVSFGWRIIFTTRDHYFDDLNHLCIDVLNVIPNKIHIPELSEGELDDLACEYTFKVPSDERLRGLLKLPFYLNAFLKFYDDSTKQSLNMPRFKDHLWNKKIKAGSIKRENVFSKLALQRANIGKFYLSVTSEDIEAAEALSKDEILGKHGTSFFISHDIYEEWDLEKFIDINYKNKISAINFFTSIGQSLAVRRSFRLWLSEQLFANDENIKVFIENSLDDDEIETIWKDELIAAILLSDYSCSFFEIFERELLQNNLKLLQRVCFILRIACKEIDNSLLSLLGLKQSNILYFTKPKGSGWPSFIDFIYAQREEIGLANLKPFIPILNEWNSTIKQGDTTKKASLLCLEYYRWLESQDSYLGRGQFTDSILNTITHGATEIKTELSNLIDEMCKPKMGSRKTSYDHLAKFILKEIGGLGIAKALPEKTLELANHCWLKEHTLDHHSRRHREAEHIFGVTDDYDLKYHPESAFQTPIFYMLGFNFKVTVDFVLNFINQVTLNLVEHYGKDNFHTHELNIDGTTTEIYLDNHLWCAYRGASSTPNLIQSILMALEKFFLENAKHFKNESLENWLKYILRKTNSSAICGVVSSIVIANQDRLFNVAKILFEVKEFITFDTSRLVFDSQHKGQLEMLGNMFGGMQHGKMYHEERIKSCDEIHRNTSLEHSFRNYQIFVVDGEMEDSEFTERQNLLWDILDNYYKEVGEQEDSENLKLWRLALARIDRRKMDITTEVIGNKVAINFNPELDSDLREMSENHSEKQEQEFKFTPLYAWAKNKLQQHNDYKKYEQYESDPKHVVSDLKELINALSDEHNPPSENFVLFNKSTHIYASVALIMYHFDNINGVDQALCIDIVEECFKKLFVEGYRYQINDGMEPCFSIIPDLFKAKPELRSLLKRVLIAGLIRTDSVDMYGSQRFNMFAILATNKLWNEFDDDVESIFLGYLLFNPLYAELIGQIRKDSFEHNKFEVSFSTLWSRLFEENKDLLEEIESNEIRIMRKVDYSSIDLLTKSVALFLLPNNQKKWSRDAFKGLVQASAATILTEDRDGSNDFHSQKEFLRKYAYYILQSPIEDLSDLIEPFIEQFNTSEGASDLLEEIIYAQDKYPSYDNFWKVWELFKPKIVQLSQEGHLSYRSDKIIRAYLFALQWKSDTKSWHTFKDKNARFFNEMAEKLSRSPSTLYSIAKLLNDIGSGYMPYGVQWIAKIIKSNSRSSKADFDDDTIYYLNTFIRKYLYRERAEVRRSPELMLQTLTVLDFLIERGEVSGYLMRESIV
jgi:hypothetical protein